MISIPKAIKTKSISINWTNEAGITKFNCCLPTLTLANSDQITVVNSLNFANGRQSGPIILGLVRARNRWGQKAGWKQWGKTGTRTHGRVQNGDLKVSNSIHRRRWPSSGPLAMQLKSCVKGKCDLYPSCELSLSLYKIRRGVTL